MKGQSNDFAAEKSESAPEYKSRGTGKGKTNPQVKIIRIGWATGRFAACWLCGLMDVKEGNLRMKYKIGEIAKYFNISSEMVRYYERMGAILPGRDNENNYRIYTAFDIFSLLEAIQMKALGINIRQIQSHKNDLNSLLASSLKEGKKQIEKQISYEKLMIKRMDDLISRYEAMRLNTGNFWVKQVPALRLFHVMDSVGDEYSSVLLPSQTFQKLCADQMVPFINAMILFQNEQNQWFLAVEETVCGQLDFENTEEGMVLESSLCLCTVVDMGEIGDFNNEVIVPLKSFAKEKGYKTAGQVFGMLLARGNDDNSYHRYMELRMPLETD